MVDQIDDASRLTALGEADLAARVCRQKFGYTVRWIDGEGRTNEVSLVGTCADRLQFMEDHGIDDLPYAYTQALSRKTVRNGPNPELFDPSIQVHVPALTG